MYLLYVCMYVCIYICMYVYMYVCMYVSIYVCMYVCVYVCMYVLDGMGWDGLWRMAYGVWHMAYGMEWNVMYAVCMYVWAQDYPQLSIQDAS